MLNHTELVDYTRWVACSPGMLSQLTPGEIVDRYNKQYASTVSHCVCCGKAFSPMSNTSDRQDMNPSLAIDSCIDCALSRCDVDPTDCPVKAGRNA